MTDQNPPAQPVPVLTGEQHIRALAVRFSLDAHEWSGRDPGAVDRVIEGAAKFEAFITDGTMPEREDGGAP